MEKPNFFEICKAWFALNPLSCYLAQRRGYNKKVKRIEYLNYMQGGDWYRDEAFRGYRDEMTDRFITDRQISRDPSIVGEGE